MSCGLFVYCSAVSIHNGLTNLPVESVCRMLIASEEKLISRLKRFCAYRERCSREIRQKMVLWGVPGEDASRIIVLLQQEGFINEERFAQLFAGGYFRQKNWGKNKIVAALRMKGIPDAAIRKGLQEIGSEQYRLVLQKLTIKLWKQYAREPIEKRKLATRAALIRKGFESDLIRQSLQKIITQKDS